MQEAPEKVNSALRADFGNRARFYDRDASIAEAMVDKDIILVMRHGQIVKLNNSEQMRLKGNEPDLVISAKGKLLTLNGEELIKLGVADVLVPSTKQEDLTKEEISTGKYPAEKHPLFHHAFFKEIPKAFIESYRMDIRTQFIAFLAHPAVASLLFLGLMISAYIELNTPGFGVAGSFALICLFFLLLSSISLEETQWLEPMFLIGGGVLILIEIFFLPTFGLVGIFGVVFFFIGLIGILLPGITSMDFETSTFTFNAAGEFVIKRLVYLSIALILAACILPLLSKIIHPKFILFRKFVLGGSQEAKLGYIATQDEKNLPNVGAIGTVFSTLRPSGKIEIAGEIYDAMSSGSFIEKGSSIIVIAIKEGRIIVDNQG